MSERLLEWRADDAGLHFPSILEGDHPFGRSEEAVHDRGVALLEELWGEEQMEWAEGELRLPWDVVYGLDASERELLDLPEPDATITGQLRTTGWVNSPDFRIWADFERPGRDGAESMLDQERSGALWMTPEGPVLAPPALGALITILGDGKRSTTPERAELVARSKPLAVEAGMTLDGYLQAEDFLIGEGVSVEVEAISPSELRLRPTVEGLDDGDLSEAVAEGRLRTTYTKRLPDGGRRRLVVPPHQREAVEEVRASDVIRGSDVPRFFDNPAAFLPDAIDVERFSPRVRGLVPKRYQSQPYLSLESSNRRDWFVVSPEIELIADAAATESLVPASSEVDAGALPPEPHVSELTEAEAHIPPEEYLDLCKQVVETGDDYALHGDSWIHIDPVRAKRFIESWDQVEVDEEGRHVIHRERAGFVLDVIANTEILEYEEAVDFSVEPEVPKYPVPASLRAQLRDYQEVGYRWMRYLGENGLGGLLADDMGLGKTIQIIAFLTYLQEEDALAPALVVVPKSLVPNWQRELAKFAPTIRRVVEHSGPGRARTPERLSLYEVVITTYETLRRDQLLLGQVDWSVIACDEAQKVKNPTAGVTAAVKGMKARFRMAATGTPVENGLTELWCIMDFAQPGKLGSRREFRDDFERPIVEAPTMDERLAASAELQARLIPHYIRRTKEGVLTELPPKTFERYSVPMGERQIDLYARILGSVRHGDTIAIAGLQRLIQVCSHGELVSPTGASVDELVDQSPKLRQTVEILDSIRGRGEKALIFTRFKGMQRILQRVVEERFGFVPTVINGAASGSNRQALVDRFERDDGFGIMVLSPEAAGVGLNITAANHAIHYTRLWNPAKENQATDRVYRIGQERPVTVHYPIVQGDGYQSVEEHLDGLLSDKLALAQDVLVPRDSLNVSGQLQDLIARDAKRVAR